MSMSSSSLVTSRHLHFNIMYWAMGIMQTCRCGCQCVKCDVDADLNVNSNLMLTLTLCLTLNVTLTLPITSLDKCLQYFSTFLPRCMQCRRGLAMRFLSVRPSVRLSNRPSVCQTRALWQNGRKICLDFYIIRKNIYPSFMRRRMVGGGRPLLSEILGQPARIGAKSPILNQ